jgi:hypothetical protein
MPHSKPQIGSAFQLASADVQTVQLPHKSQPAASESADNADQQPQTPADIINARGFWGDAAPKQATPEQVAAINARRAVGADPQSTASVSAAFNALAYYAPAASSPVDRANVVAASAPIPRSTRPAAAQQRNSMAVNDVTTVIAKGSQDRSQGQGSVIATSTRITASKANDTWMRMLILAPSASTSMSSTVLGDADMTLMRSYFVKPPTAIVMVFSDDPQMGLVSDRFTGSATATLEVTSFVLRTASLH